MKYFIVSIFLIAFSLLWFPRSYVVTGGIGKTAVANFVVARPQMEEQSLPAVIKTVTAYSLSKDETDLSPCIGAYNDNLCTLKIAVCASNEYKRGTRLLVGDRECVVLDRMNRKYNRRVDLLMPTKQDAYNFGIKELPVAVME